MRNMLKNSATSLWARGMCLSLLTLIFCIIGSGSAFANTVFVTESAAPMSTSATPVISSISSVKETTATSTFLSLGDSIAYGMSATPGNDYVHLFYNHIHATPTYSQLSLTNLAVSGDTSSDLLTKLQTAPYIAAVRKAKVITLSIGGNNLLSPVIGTVCTAFGVSAVNNPNLMVELATAMITNPNKDAILAGIANSPILAQALQSGVGQLGTDSPRIIGALKALSPQAEIYVLNLYNPFNETDPLYTLFDPLIKQINQVLVDNTIAGYKVADVYTKFTETPGAVNFNLATLQLDPHPTTVGHAAIYQALLEVAPTNPPGTPVTLVITNVPSTVTAKRALSITVTAKDELGNTVTGYKGKVHFSSTDSQAKLSKDYTFKSSDKGSHTFKVNLETSGIQSITVNDTVKGSLKVTSDTITVTPDVATKLAITAPSTAILNSELTITVMAKDVSGNTATGYVGKVHFTSTDKLAGLPTDYTFTSEDNGSHSFSIMMKTLGKKTLTVKDMVTSKVKAASKKIVVTTAK